MRRWYSVYDLYTMKYLGRVKANSMFEACEIGERKFGRPVTTKCKGGAA